MKTVKTAANGFANPVPATDANGVTAYEFMAAYFEFSYCDECGHDLDKHTAVIGPFGNWFAHCDEVQP